MSEVPLYIAKALSASQLIPVSSLRGPYHQPSERSQIISFEPPDLCRMSPDSGEPQCKPREVNKVI